MTLEVQNLHVRTEEREILHGVDLVVKKGETHALMGPNGSGKSTLANTLMGNPNYEVTEGRILLNGEDLTEADPDERARAGLFMAFQYPATIPGVSVANFMRMAVNARREEPIKVKEFGAMLKEEHGPPEDQPRLHEPLPERGLLRRREEARRDPPARDAPAGVRRARRDRLRARHRRAADRLRGRERDARRRPRLPHHHALHAHPELRASPDFVHILLDGRIVREGGSELADELEDKGYEFVREEVAASGA